MKNWSPEKVWTNGMIGLRNQPLIQVSEMHGIESSEDLVWYGYDPDALSLATFQQVTLMWRMLKNPLNRIAFERLFGIDPLGNSESFGVNIFLEALRVISEPI